MHSTIRDLVNIAPGVELQDEDTRPFYLIDEPVLTDPCPEAGLVTFALFDIKISCRNVNEFGSRWIRILGETVY